MLPTHFFKLVLGFCVHGFGVLRTVREDGIRGMPLIGATIVVVLFDAVPCADNNLFFESWRVTALRMLGLVGINTYRAERWKSGRKDNAIRSFLQLEVRLCLCVRF